MGQNQKMTPKSSAPMPYFSLRVNHDVKMADIYIFGNIAQRRGGLGGLFQASSDQSSYDLANQVSNIPKDYLITVHINSNGGELKEGLGIYNVLKEREVTTICEGFAASAGSVIFCAGKTRIMQPASLLFIHQASMSAAGNADELAKASEDLKIVTAAAVAAYKECGITVSDDDLYAMLKAETWITPEDAVKMGFATQIATSQEEDDEIQNDAMASIMAAVSEPPKMIEVPESILETMKVFCETSREYTAIFELAGKALDVMNKDPEMVHKLKAAAEMLLATNPTPKSPAQVEHKGFFGF